MKPQNENKIKNQYIFNVLSFHFFQTREKIEVSIKSFQDFYTKKMERQYGNSRNCKTCNIDIHRASFAKHLTGQKLLKTETIIPTNFFNESVESSKTNKKNITPNLSKK